MAYYNSTIKPKKGPCVECTEEGDSSEKTLTGKLCQKHYRTKKQTEAYEKQQSKPPKIAKQIRQVSDKEATRLRKYWPIAKKFKEDNPECQIRVAGCTYWTTEVHHPEGRDGDLLCKVELFVGGCHNCHMWAEAHPTEAKARGVSRNRIAKNN